jgi:hypothetical protein
MTGISKIIAAARDEIAATIESVGGHAMTPLTRSALELWLERFVINLDAARREMAEHRAHTYPRGYDPKAPDQAPEVKQAWEIVDIVTPGTLSDGARDLLAGMIAGSIKAAHERGKLGKPL